jgi:ribosomal protein S18 acetylase RimI-like enzyme
MKKVLNPQDFKIHALSPDDISKITKLVNAAYKELADRGLNYTATYQNDEKTLDRVSKGRCFVLKNLSGEIIGTILITVENYFTNRHTAYLGQFGVLPEYKGAGLGTMLMEYCESVAKSEGFEGIQLDTAIPAKHLVDWYLRRGYQIVGKEQYEGKNYESYVFEKLF